MGAPVAIRTELEAAELRPLARRERDGRVTVRLIAAEPRGADLAPPARALSLAPALRRYRGHYHWLLRRLEPPRRRARPHASLPTTPACGRSGLHEAGISTDFLRKAAEGTGNLILASRWRNLRLQRWGSRWKQRLPAPTWRTVPRRVAPWVVRSVPGCPGRPTRSLCSPRPDTPIGICFTPLSENVRQTCWSGLRRQGNLPATCRAKAWPAPWL